MVVYPADALSGLPEKSFYANDTHWTHRGAMLATMAVCGRLGIDRRTLAQLFEQDAYVERDHVGDLGVKLDPPRPARAEMLCSYDFARQVVYDNGVLNSGHVMAVENERSLLASSCLIFGASSTHAMLNYLTRVFRQLVFVHSAGNVDMTLVRAIGPDYLIAQTSERYLITPPQQAYDLAKIIRSKLAGVDEAEQGRPHAQRVDSSEATLERLGLLGWDLWRPERAPTAAVS